MGRKKATPQHLPVHDGTQSSATDTEALTRIREDEVLGRVVTETSINDLFAEEVQQANRAESLSAQQSIDNNDPVDQTVTRKKKKSDSKNQRNGRHTAAATLQERLQQILQDQQAKSEERKRKRRERKSTPSNSPSRRQKRARPKGQNSQHAIQEEDEPLPEVEISCVDGQLRIVLLSNPQSDHEKPQKQVPLRQWTLPKGLMTNANREPCSSANMYLSSGRSVKEILSHCNADESDRSNGSSRRSLTNSWESLSMAIDQGTLYCKLASLSSLQVQGDGSESLPSRILITIGLVSDNVLDAGNPSNVIIQPKGKKQRQQRATVLLQALAEILPTSIMADLVSRTGGDASTAATSASSVTAKQVYALVDNAQYDQWDEKPSLDIPGLVPTLRPYQQAAVDWMLQRERGSSPTSASRTKEWELAWLVITPYLTNSLSATRTSEEAEHSFQFQPLSIWIKRQYPSSNVDVNPQTNVLFYCPFTGWWASSYDQARNFTLGDISEEVEVKEECKGGILAESMGLGKTVEVLACILANPRRSVQSPLANPDTTPQVNSTTIEAGCKPAKPTGRPASLSESKTISKEIDDTGSSSEEEEFEFEAASSKVDRKDAAGVAVERNTATETDQVLPEEIYLDYPHQTIGVCICGHTITLQEKLPITVCGKCEEPMHAACAGYDEDKVSVNKRLYRYGRRVLECSLCPEDHCPCCVASSANDHKVKSRATLIVTPAAILSQWQREIQKHTALPTNENVVSMSTTIGPDSRPLKTLVYKGIKSLCNQSGKKALSENSLLIHPKHLADADVVLMTFEALMGDLNHSNDNPFVSTSDPGEGRSLRQRKVYRVVPSPLLSIDWWRVCLDEAQRVETPTAASAKMALKLQANYRWCVSGTPVGRGKMEDLYGLLLFLRLQPFANKAWFSACFQAGQSGLDHRIEHLLHAAFWRSTKASERVRQQMNIPEQIEKKVILEFNSVEKHLYQRQHEETLNIASELQTREKAGKKQSATMMSNLAMQLQKLRAACCHPQVGSSGLGRVRKQSRGSSSSQESLTIQGQSRILTMEQILDRLIDDARLKVEEAQRLCLLHNNAMAALAKLKVYAKDRGVSVQHSNSMLLTQSCKLYLESLKLIDDNSKASRALGEAILTGCTGFQFPQKVVRDGNARLHWRIQQIENEERVAPRELWARFDFEGPAKRITEIRLRNLPSRTDEMQTDAHWNGLQVYPKTCIFQVSSSAIGGAFVDVVKFDLPVDRPSEPDSQWTVLGNFRTNRSKSWRILILDYHHQDDISELVRWETNIEIELFEPEIGGDSLQRLHALHNASLSFELLMKIREEENSDEADFFSQGEMTDKIATMRDEATKIESLYMNGIIPIHEESRRLLKAAVDELHVSEHALFESRAEDSKTKNMEDCWDDAWWDDILIMTSQLGSSHEQYELCRRVHEDINSAMDGAFDRRELAKKPFPPFNDTIGLYHAVTMRMQDTRSVMPRGSLKKSLQKFLNFPRNPTHSAILESSTCERCKKDWTWTGPMCGHCKLSLELMEQKPDRLLAIVLGSIYNWMKGGRSTAPLATARIDSFVDERAKLFFDALEATKKAKSAAERSWRVHLDLLNDHDELNMCKGAMRLVQENEDLSRLTDAELNGVVHPIDVASSFLDHEVKQASSFAQLRRHSSTLRYLKNQSRERAESSMANALARKGAKDKESCILCLSEFEGTRAVLVCGHSFHYSPCLERLMARSGSNAQYVPCPLRCSVRTKRSEIMIASDQKMDVPRQSIPRKIIGSWGTKVTRLVSDVLGVADKGEKSIVFSQWEDMMDVVEEAFKLNKISFVRVTGMSKIAACTKRFRSQDCNVLLLNVKNGAEGLTLVEATHVFMVEPLLNCGLDLQAINRIHRIGQTSTTFVHRYLIKDTVEMKIDKWRMEHQEDQLEDELVRSRHQRIKAGGIDGGFSSQEELMRFLTIK